MATCPAIAPVLVWAAVLAVRVFPTGPEAEEVLATGRAEPIASEAGISRGAVVETGMLSEGVREDIADRMLAAAAAAAPPVWDPEAAEEALAAAAVVVGGAGR